MRTRRLGNSDLGLTTVGFGAWAIGGNWAYGWGAQDDQDSVRAIHRALDLGVNWIDTAAVYGLGHSEEVVAKALADRPGRVIVATKCGLRWRDSGAIYGSLNAESIRYEVEQSLRRLRVETIDLYQVHWPNPDRDIEQGWAVMSDLVKEGKIRYAGLSNFDVSQIKRAQSIFPVASLQPPYSMINRAVEQELLPFCAEQGIGVVAYSPMQCGLLTGSFSAQRLARLDPQDWRHKDASFKEPVFSKALALVERLRPFAEQRQRSLAELAIAWVLRRPEMTAAIVGGRRPDQVEQTAPAGDWELAASEVEELERILVDVAVPRPGPIR